MRAQRHSSRTGTAAAHQAAAPRVMARPRPTWGNHARLGAKDNHERQADEAADRIVRGEQGVVHLLSPAPAATFRAPASRGEALPAGLRRDLESGFGADLSVVRIHRDAAAASATRAERALAFAAGPEIFFSEGAFAPHSSAGRDLIAHEVAHVLQQTGRAGSDGRIRATAVESTGDVQRNGPYDDSLVSFLSSGEDALKEVSKRHGDAKTADETLKALIGLVKKESGGSLPRKSSSTIGMLLIKIAGDGNFTDPVSGTTLALTFPARGFLVDCLKVCGTDEHFKAAASVLEVDAEFKIKSAFGPRQDFRDFLNTNEGEDWVAGAFKYPALRKSWPAVFLDSFEQYVLNPGRPRQGLYFFQDSKDTELKNIDATTEDLLANDRVVMAFALLEAYDDRRLAMLTALDQKLADKGLSLTKPDQRYSAARFLAGWLTEQQASETAETWRGMLGKMHDVAAAAAIFWEQVGAQRGTYQAELAKHGFDTYQGLLSGLKRPFAPGDPTFQPLHDALLSAGQPGGLFFLDATQRMTDIPTPTDYRKRIDALGAALGLGSNREGNVLLVLQQQLIKTYEKGELDTDSARALGLVIFLLLDLQPVLLDYRPADDKDGFTDMRLAHRAHVAVQIGALAQIAGWDDVLQLSGTVVLGDDVEHSYLIVKGGWEIQFEAPVGQMVTDFAANKPASDELKLTPAELAEFFHGDMLRRISEAVEDAVEAAHNDPKNRVSAEKVNAEVRKLPRPWRCVPVDAMVILRPSELAPAAGNAPNPNQPTAMKLIEASAKSIAELKRLASQQNLGLPFYRLAKKESLELFAWILPDIAPLIRHLRTVEPFMTRMEKLSGLGDLDWMKKLVEVTGSEEQLGKEVFGETESYAKKQQTDLNFAFRAFTALNRRQVRGPLAAKLGRFAKDSSVTNFEVPTQVVEAVFKFQGAVAPPQDAGTQAWLLVLSLGSELAAAFPGINDAAKIPPYFHDTLTRAVEFVDKEAGPAAAGKDANFKAAIEALLYVDPNDHTKNETLDEFVTHRDELNALAKRMDEARTQLQQMFGFASDDGVTLKSLLFYPRIQPGRKNAFEMGGDDWELVQVHQKFTYHPELDESAATNKAAQPILLDGSGNRIPIDDRLLVSFLVNGVEYDVHASDRRKLHDLSNSLADVGFAVEMENLAEGLETGAMVMMDVVELIPGVGQELMTARLVAQTAQFLIAELPQIAEALKKDPVGYIEDLGKKLVTKYLTLEGVITYLVLGQGFGPAGGQGAFDDERKPTPVNTNPQHAPTGKLGRVISILRKLGMRLAEGVQWLQLRIAGPVRSLQSAIATRPKLGWVLRKAIEGAAWVAGLIPPDLGERVGAEDKLLAILGDLLPGGAEIDESKPPEEQKTQAQGLIARIEGEITKSGEEFKEQLEQRLELFREAELPNEIVPLELLVGFILDFFIGRLGAKVRIARALLEPTQEYQDLKSKVEKALAVEARGTVVDPNKYWRDLILDKIEEQFVEARNGLVDGIYGLSDKVADETGIAAFRLARPAAKTKETFGITRTPFPEAELAAIEGEVPDTGGLGKLPTTPGQPLAVVVRETEERRFGHDFGHVRLHAGEESRAALEALHAEAATSGSHVFLRPGLDPTQGKGARILRHELTHVLQQTGPRPLDRKHQVGVVRGRPGEGLRVDRLREAAAKAMAEADRSVAHEPVRVDGGAEGVQPSLEDVAVKVLEMLTEFHKIEEFEKATGGKAVPGEQVAKQAWTLVKNAFSSKKAITFAPFAKPVADHIAKHVAGTDLTQDLPKVAELAQKPVKGARGKKPKTELDFDRFVTLLEAVVFGRTGITVQLKLKGDPSPTFESAEVTYIHLGFVNPGPIGASPLWDEVMKNTPGIVASGDDAGKVRYEIHERLRVLGPEPFIWSTGTEQYRFSMSFVEAFNKVRASRKPELANMPAKGAQPPEKADVKPPAKDEYLNPSGQTGLGLRIGVHGGQKGPDRESHHTTQYLLIQFFRNNNRSVKAWQSGKTYPGIVPSTGDERKEFRSASKGVLGLASLDPGGKGNRGTAMPAILLSADTHRRGQLHIEREGRWLGPQGDPDSFDDQGRPTQGFTIRNEFQSQLKAHVGTFDTSPDWESKMKAPDASDKIYDAMIGTYHWMRDTMMMPALENGLKTRELAYYRAIVSRSSNHVLNQNTGALKPEYDLTVSDMDAVFKRAKDNNDSVMGASPNNWK